MPQPEKKRAPLNRTLNISNDEIDLYKKRLIKLSNNVEIKNIAGHIINQDLFDAVDYLPDNFS